MPIDRREQTRNIKRAFKKEIPKITKEMFGVERGFNEQIWKTAVRLARKSVVTGFGQSHSISGVARTIYRQHLGYEVHEEIGTFTKSFRKFEGSDLVDEYLANHDVDIQKMYIENRTRKLVENYGDKIVPMDTEGRTVAKIVDAYMKGDINLNTLSDYLTNFRKEAGLDNIYDKKYQKESDFFS